MPLSEFQDWVAWLRMRKKVSEEVKQIPIEEVPKTALPFKKKI